MSILDIRVLGDPVLRVVTAPITEVTDAHRRLIDDMFDTMYHARGIGLAAPQVGRTERLAIVDVDDDPFVLINPEIVVVDGKKAKGEEVPQWHNSWRNLNFQSSMPEIPMNFSAMFKPHQYPRVAYRHLLRTCYFSPTSRQIPSRERLRVSRLQKRCRRQLTTQEFFPLRKN